MQPATQHESSRNSLTCFCATLFVPLHPSVRALKMPIAHLSSTLPICDSICVPFLSPLIGVLSTRQSVFTHSTIPQQPSLVASNVLRSDLFLPLVEVYQIGKQFEMYVSGDPGMEVYTCTCKCLHNTRPHHLKHVHQPAWTKDKATPCPTT